MKKYFILILIFLGAGVWWTQNVKHQVSDTAGAVAVKSVKLNFPHAQINKLKIPVEVARTPAAAQHRLSGRESLAADKGMLFIFNKPDYYRFWMPNMNFPIDIIWISQNTIAGIHKNVSNQFDPANPKFYTPPQPVNKVLEVNAGFAQKNNLKVGDPFNFVQGRPE